MTDIKATIAGFVPKNEELLAILARTDYASPALQQQNVYIQDLETELAKVQRAISGLESKTKIEQKDFEKYRDSTMKRFAYKMGGSKGKDKFASRTEKEEKEYYEALHAERSAKDHRDSLQKMLGEAQGVRTQYQQDKDSHDTAQNELDNLYNMIFAGPTPAYPEEDLLELPYSQARNTFGDAERTYQALSQALQNLREAQARMHRAQQHIADALYSSRIDMFGGGALADMQERDAMGRAESEASQAKGLVEQARRIYPGVQPLPQIRIAQGSLMGDVLFDNIFSDMAFHDEIKRSDAELANAAQHLLGQTEQIGLQEQQQRRELDEQSQKLHKARMDLQKARQTIFEREKADQPPAYSA